MEIDPNDHLIPFNSAGIFIKMGDAEFALDGWTVACRSLAALGWIGCDGTRPSTAYATIRGISPFVRGERRSR